MRGGVHYSTVVRDENTGRERVARHTTRPIIGISENIKVNSALWMLAENMRCIKVGKPIL